MIGNMMSLTGYLAVFGLLWLWLCIKIGRSSPLLGIGTFFFSPLALYCLIRYWGDEESDIRIPFFLAAVALGGMSWAATRTMDSVVNEGAIYLTDADIAAIRVDNPEYADQLEAARAEAFANAAAPDGVSVPAGIVVGPGAGSVAPPNRALPTAAEPTQIDVSKLDPGIEQRYQRRSVLRQVSFERGTIALPLAQASLELPRQYRYAPAGQLGPLGRLYGRPVDADVIGWVVHERIDLAADDAWFVELRFDPIGHVATPSGLAAEDFAANALQRTGGTAAGYAPGRHGPQWDGRSGVLTWVRVPGTPAPVALGQAAKPLRSGVLRFVAIGVPADERELALRATRMLATRARAERGWEHAAHDAKRDPIAGVDLAGYITAVDAVR
jgi:hypothetical protein